MKRTFAILMMIVVFAVNTMAQDYRFEIGAALGTSGYLGDVNRGNFLRNPGVNGGALFRFIKDYRWAFKGSLNVATTMRFMRASTSSLGRLKIFLS